MWFKKWNINPSGNVLFTFGMFCVNLYTTFYLLYKKSLLCMMVTGWCNLFIPTTKLEYIPNVENCDFMIYTFDKIHKKICKVGEPVFEENYTILKDPPFLSTEILVTSSDGKSVTNYEIDFRTDRYDYYVAGNVFHKKFISYFMKTHYSINLFNCDYSIHAVDRVTFDPIVYLKNSDPIKIN
jgi:hypothetical protein